ncbi:trichohyalin isoform X1 [Gadus macrocephalus]|uniref:trichohyalin isoform X1 n=1 Tax=Gadus macrocephalus TaxID=80720 RepID=UPI0028CB3724|nr:trichohyalin isoform X1 [Gadus macrocephalus]
MEEMDTNVLIGWQEERVRLRRDVSRLQDELAESHAEREELTSRSHALDHRLVSCLDPSLSLRGSGEEKDWRRRVREGREREARQALLIHKLQNKVVEFRERYQEVKQRLKGEERELANQERRLLDAHSDSLESTLFRLEEQQQRSIGLAEGNSFLRQQLSQSEQTNLALREDLHKLTADWSRAVEEAELKEVNWQKEKEGLLGHVTKEQGRLMCLWRSVITLRRDCLSLKTATDRDLCELRSGFSSLSSSLLTCCDSFTSVSLPLAPPLHSTLGPCQLEELLGGEEEKEEKERDLTELKGRVTELSLLVQSLERERERWLGEKIMEEKERRVEEEKERSEVERSYQSLSQAILTLSRVLGSSPTKVDHLSSLLAVLSQADSALQMRHQKLQEAEVVRRRLEEQKESLQDRLYQLEADHSETNTLLQTTHLQLVDTQQKLARERETVMGLQAEVELVGKREEEEKRESKRMRREMEREEEERRHVKRDGQKRVEEGLMEIAQLKERELRGHMEIYSLKGAVEREKLDRQRANEEAVEAGEALQKTRDSMVLLVCDQNLMKRQLAETRDSLNKMAALNQSLVEDKMELNTHILQVEAELADGQCKLHALRSEVTSLQRDLRVLSQDYNQLKTHIQTEEEVLLHLREREQAMERAGEERERKLVGLIEEREREGEELKELCTQHALVRSELQEACSELSRVTEEKRRADRGREELQRRREELERERRDKLSSLERERELQVDDREQLRCTLVSLHQQLRDHQQQVSVLEMDRQQLLTQTLTLQQTKDTLQGEMVFLKEEVELGRSQEEEQRERRQEEGRSRRRQVETLVEEVEELSKMRKEGEAGRDREREVWQRERECLSKELGRREAEQLVSSTRLEEVSTLLRETEREVERLQHTQRHHDKQVEEERGTVSLWRERAQEEERQRQRLTVLLAQAEERMKKGEKEVKRQVEVMRSSRGEERERLNLSLQQLSEENKRLNLTEREREKERLEEERERLEEEKERVRLTEERERKRAEEMTRARERERLVERERQREMEALCDQIEKLEKLGAENEVQQSRMISEEKRREGWRKRAEEAEKEREEAKRRLLERELSHEEELKAERRVREEAEERLRRAESQMRTRGEEMERMNQRVLGLQGEQVRVEGELLRRREEEREREIDLLRSREREREIDLLRRREEEKEREIDLLRSRVEDRESEIDLLKRREGEREREIDLLRSREEERGREIDLLKRREEEREREIDLLRRRGEEREREIDLLKRSEEEREIDLKRREGEREREIDLLRSGEEERGREIDLLRNREEEREKEINLLRSREEEKKSETDLLRRREEERGREYELNKVRMSVVEEERDEMKKQLEEKDRNLEHQRSILRVKEKEVNTLQEQAQLLQEEVGEERREREEQQRKREERDAELRSRLAELEDKQSRGRERGEREREERERIKEEMRQAEEENRRLQEKVRKLKGEREGLGRRLEEVESRQRLLQEELEEELKRTREELRGARHNMVSGLEVWKVEEERMRRGIKTSLEEVDSLKHLLSERTEEAQHLHSALLEGKQEVERVKEETLQAAREEVLRQREEMDKEREEERGELQGLRARTNALIQRRGEVKEELEREMVEREWRTRMEVLEEQKKGLSEEVSMPEEKRERDLKNVKQPKEGEKPMADRRSRMSGGTEEDRCGGLSSLFQETEEILLEDKEEEVYLLTKRTGELAEDRDRILSALEQTEAALISYKERGLSNEDIDLVPRVALLQRTVAELEVDQRRLTTRSSQLKHQNHRLRSHRKVLRRRLRMVEEERGILSAPLTQSDSRSQQIIETDGETPRLKNRIRELEEQVHRLRLTLSLDSQEMWDFIESSSKNNQSVLSLRRDLSLSLDAVSRKPLQSVLQTETQRLDRSLREEEFRMSLSHL